MMVCLSCNKVLNDYESTRKYKGTNEYIDLCGNCFSASDLLYMPIQDRPELDTVKFTEIYDEEI